MEYMTTYGWAILIIAVVASILYLYTAAPTQLVSNTCNFVNGAYCNDMVIATNTLTHVTTVGFFLTNTQKYPLKNPQLYVSVNNANTTQFPCTPNFVLAGGSILCTVTVPVNSNIGSFLSGGVYMNATYCGLSSTSYANAHNCSAGVKETYVGNFAGHAQPFVSTQSTISLSAVNYTQVANGNPDQLSAVIKLLGYPLKGATVNFTSSNTLYVVSPNLTTTNAAGSAISFVSGNTVGTVTINAIYAGLSNSITIAFAAPIIISFVPTNYTYCSTSPTTAYIDGTPYTCSQLSTKLFSFSKGSTHTYQFLTPVSIASNIQEAFKNVMINGIPYTSASGTVTAVSNATIPLTYYTQYYLSQIVSPTGAGSVSPGNEWFSALTSLTLSETATFPYIFNGWVGTGTGSYTVAIRHSLNHG